MTSTQHLSTPTYGRDGRSVTSELALPDREDSTRIVLRVTTSGGPGGRYHATASRPLISRDRGFAVEKLAMTFGADSDIQRLPIPADASTGTRFSRKTLTMLHARVIALIQEDIDRWVDWAADSTAARRD